MEKQSKSVRTIKNKSSNAALFDLGRAVGDFIRYWGFRRIHGEIWTHLFLSQQPLSGADLVKNLKVSKALISPAIRQLEKYRLIRKVSSEDPREKRYVAESDYLVVIKSVLMQREAPMLSEIQSLFLELQKQTHGDPSQGSKINLNRLYELQNMTLQANFLVAALLSLNEFSDINLLAEALHQNSVNSNKSPQANGR